MLDSRKIRDMTKLAICESGESREVIRICSYKRVDYCVLQAVKGCVAGTVCFAAAFGLWVLYIWDDVNTYFYDAQYMDFFKKVLGWYSIFMFVYLVVCVLVALHKHKKCRTSREKYLKYLQRIHRYYKVRDRRMRAREKYRESEPD